MSDEVTPQATDLGVWAGEGWTARVQKNEDDDGWAVSMTRDGDAEPVLVSPWTMGRDKKNPKPLNPTDFKTLLKAARDVLTRHEAAERARLHRSITVIDAAGRKVRVDLDVVADEDDPHAMLTAWSTDGEQLAERRVAPTYELRSSRATKWVESGLGEP